MSISDWFVLAPWLAFAIGVIIFFIWLRRPPGPPRRTRLPRSTTSQPCPTPAAERHSGHRATESERHETSAA